ncbi:39S ribosomal protein L55, mitochondrial [Caerostris extrusa]|uniref:39S ribosomal protein L55, mitochondrial n=1 Tax=Caerostris extrusa TaxID=172846 RepID=A0AAV4Q0R1_CAEEX|nr:39S ribosomal protein L55, mitochondrial [Caerostris extrusa]
MSSRVVSNNISYLIQQLRHNSNRASIVKIGREKYCRMYLTTLVNPDGSSITIRYHEPRRIIKLPMDVSQLTPEELQKHLNRRKEEEKVVVEEIIDDGFDVNRYSYLWKKNPEDK